MVDYKTVKVNLNNAVPTSMMQLPNMLPKIVVVAKTHGT